MANKDPKILCPDEYQKYYHTSPEGHLCLDDNKNLIPKTQTLTGNIESVDPQIYWQSRVTRTGFHSLEVPVQKGSVVNSTSITQQPPQHTTPASSIDQLHQGIDPNEPILGEVLSDEKIDKSLLGKIVSTFSGGVSTFMGTPQRNNNANSDNSETSSVASKTNKDLRYTQQNLERIKTEIVNQYRIQVAIEKKTFEKEIQNYYHNHFKTIENEHKEKLSTIEAKIAEQMSWPENQGILFFFIFLKHCK